MEDRKARIAALAARAGRTKKVGAAPEEPDAGGGGSRDHPRMEASINPYLSSSTKEGEDTSHTNVEEQKPSPAHALALAPLSLPEALARARAQVAAVRSEKPDAVVMAPKKINWDLKRDIQPKLDKLEKRTQKAIVNLLRERLEREATTADDID
jgi:coiled-coil domain-containing protein 12